MENSDQRFKDFLERYEKTVVDPEYIEFEDSHYGVVKVYEPTMSECLREALLKKQCDRCGHFNHGEWFVIHRGSWSEEHLCYECAEVLTSRGVIGIEKLSS